MRTRFLPPLVALLCLVFISAEPTSQPQNPLDPVKAAFAGQFAQTKDVVKVCLPRIDLNLMVDGFQLPEEAGLESTFHFWKCPCGKLHVYGSFLLCDYEVNDVIDELRAGHIMVVSVGAFFQFDRPRMMQLRFQGEGKPEDLVKSIQKAMQWVGENRMAPAKP